MSRYERHPELSDRGPDEQQAHSRQAIKLTPNATDLLVSQSNLPTMTAFASTCIRTRAPSDLFTDEQPNRKAINHAQRILQGTNPGFELGKRPEMSDQFLNSFE